MNDLGPTSILYQLRSLLRTGVKIGITGAAGAGKSTFAKFLCGNELDLLHDEGVRDWLIMRGIRNFAKIDSLSFSELHLHLLNRYRTSKASIFDRTPADLFFYASHGKADFIDITTLENACKSLQSMFDMLIILPFHLPFFVTDFARDDNKLTHMRDAGIILDIICRWGQNNDTLIYDHSITPLDNAELIYRYLSDKNN